MRVGSCSSVKLALISHWSAYRELLDPLHCPQHYKAAAHNNITGSLSGLPVQQAPRVMDLFMAAPDEAVTLSQVPLAHWKQPLRGLAKPAPPRLVRLCNQMTGYAQ